MTVAVPITATTMPNPNARAATGPVGARRFRTDVDRPNHTTGWIAFGGSGSRRSRTTATTRVAAFKANPSSHVICVLMPAWYGHASRTRYCTNSRFNGIIDANTEPGKARRAIQPIKSQAMLADSPQPWIGTRRGHSLGPRFGLEGHRHRHGAHAAPENSRAAPASIRPGSVWCPDYREQDPAGIRGRLRWLAHQHMEPVAASTRPCLPEFPSDRIAAGSTARFPS